MCQWLWKLEHPLRSKWCPEVTEEFEEKVHEIFSVIFSIPGGGVRAIYTIPQGFSRVG